MKSHRRTLAMLPLALVLSANASEPTGFYMPDSTHQITISYHSVRDLIVLPVTINDSIQVHLILDTGCRNLVLFGKRFQNMFNCVPGRPIVFSGLGNGRPVKGKLALGNRVAIAGMWGNDIPVVVVENSNLFSKYRNVDGVVGYEIFLKFEIELNARQRTVTFRRADKSLQPDGYTIVPLRVVDSRPVIEATIDMGRREHRLDLMIDTGSSLGLLVKTTNAASLYDLGTECILGIGLNGSITGFKTVAERVNVGNLKLTDVATAVVSSPWHNNASIGMEVLKNYVVVINYCRSYAAFSEYDGKKRSHERETLTRRRATL